jgi:hypothetical protein
MTTIALFGEAERGRFRTAYFCQSLQHLDEYLGNPPPNSKALYYAVQALLYKRSLIFFRVPEEGFSSEDYLFGMRLLKEQQLFPQLHAICLPGVGDPSIINAIEPLMISHHSILIMDQADLYDYLTAKNSYS